MIDLDDEELVNVDDVLALHLLFERSKGTQSRWWSSHISRLPTGYSTPLYLSQEEFSLLKGSNVEWETKQLFTQVYRTL